jgi:hypothetical protein
MVEISALLPSTATCNVKRRDVPKLGLSTGRGAEYIYYWWSRGLVVDVYGARLLARSGNLPLSPKEARQKLAAGRSTEHRTWHVGRDHGLPERCAPENCLLSCPFETYLT